uniref:Uncharacterized protein n=1 Tax=Setaria italica TaxID=4555 RepID=K3ZM71_SETIT
MDRDRDQLTAAIETTEHSRHVRGLSSTLPCCKAFQNDQASYRKMDRYKKDLEEKMREIAKQEFVEFLASQQLQTITNPTVSNAQGQAEPTLQLAHTGFFAPSSAGSITNLRCPVDDIQNYEHGKPFLYRWDLLEGPWKLNKLHGWVMTPMKQGIRAITARVPKKIFLGVLDYEIVIDFENLHRLYCHQHLDANLVTYQKQPNGTVLCRYYVCEFLRKNGSIPNHQSSLVEGQINNIFRDMARFIQLEICHEDGAFFDPNAVLMPDECKGLRRWMK